MSEATIFTSRYCKTVMANDHHINQIWLSSYIYPAIAASNELGVLKALSNGHTTTEQISVELDLDFRATEILLNVLTSVGFIKASENNSFEFTEQGSTFLDPNSAFSWQGMFAREAKNPLVQQIIQSSRKSNNNNSTRPDFLLTNDWADNVVNPQDAASITLGMHSESAATAVIQAKALSTAKIKSVLDVGGGSGVFSIALAEALPGLTCTVAELPSVLESTKTYLKQSPAHDRLKTLPFNMFKDSWPTGYDAMFFSNILHDWDPPVIRHLLQNAFQALPKGGTILINEMLMGPSKSMEASAFSVVMLIRTLGKQLTFTELKAYLIEAGFTDVTSVPSDSIFDIVRATKP